MTQTDRPEAEPCPAHDHGPEDEHWLNRWRHLPYVDPDKMRRDLDEVIDPSL